MNTKKNLLHMTFEIQDKHKKYGGVKLANEIMIFCPVKLVEFTFLKKLEMI